MERIPPECANPCLVRTPPRTAAEAAIMGVFCLEPCRFAVGASATCVEPLTICIKIILYKLIIDFNIVTIHKFRCGMVPSVSLELNQIDIVCIAAMAK